VIVNEYGPASLLRPFQMYEVVPAATAAVVEPPGDGVIVMV
jgi:hypothetical protein